MGRLHHIEVYKSGKWHQYSSTPFQEIDDAARECLLIMPDIKRHFGGIRIVAVDGGKDDLDEKRETVYQKMWETSTIKGASRHAVDEGNNNKRKYMIITIIALIVLLVVSFYLYQYGGYSSVSATAPQSRDQANRSSYISHQPGRLPDKSNASGERTAVTHAKEAMEQLLTNHQKLPEQASDVMSVIDVLDHENCSQRDAMEMQLTSVFFDYVSRSKASALDKVNAENIMLLRAKQGQITLKERDRVLIELGCTQLLEIAKLYVTWFATHR